MKRRCCFLVLTFGFFSLCYGDCRFPEFLRPKGDNSTWIIRHHDTKDVTVHVKSTRLIVKECKLGTYRSCKSIERVCNVDYGNNKYLVREIITDSSTEEWESRYRCMQFIPRGKSVVQLKISQYLSDRRSRNLCDDSSLLLDLTPMIFRELAEIEENECPLVGGFDFNLYIPGQEKPLCHDIFLPLRIESDCTQREGIKLYFRRRNCSSLFVGRRIDTDPVHLNCVATWKYLEHTYSIVKWHGSPEFWCVMVKYDGTDPLEIYFYFSGACFTNERFAIGKTFVLKYFNIHYVSNICEDENNLMCSYHNCSTDNSENCKLSCSLCEPEKEERGCAFPWELHGYWNSLQNPQTSALIIDNETFVHNHSKWHCVTSTSSELMRSRRKVMKLKFDNGCHPRYQCIDIEHPSESVLRYRTGTELHWPIAGLEEVCQNRYFEYTPLHPEVTGIAPTPGPWNYFINDSPKFVTCNLPWYIPKVAFYDMYDSNAKHVNYGCLMNRNGNPGHMIYLHYIYQDIHKQWSVHKEMAFICLASIRFIGENDVLITKNVHEGVYMCWSFYRDRERNYVSIYNARDCGNGTNMQLVHYSAQKALATLVLHKNSSICESLENSEKVMTRRSDDDGLSNLTENNTNSVSFIPQTRLCIVWNMMLVGFILLI